MDLLHRGTKEKALKSILEDTEWVESTLLNNADADTADYQAQLITIRLANHMAKRLLVIVSGRGVGGRKVDVDLKALLELSGLLTEYKDILKSYLKKGDKGGIKRVFKSSKLRKRLDQVNAKLHKKLGQFVEQIKSEATDSPPRVARASDDNPPSPTASSPGRHKPSTAAGSGASQTTIASDSPRSDDGNGRSPSYVSSSHSWVNLFHEDIMVPWDEFVSQMREGSPEVNEMLDDALEAALKAALDSNNTGSVAVFRWEDFAKAFGPPPLPSLLQKARNTMFAPWFHGHLTAPDAEKLLHGRGVGTFLVRFSLSISGSFAIAFVAAGGTISHTLVVPKVDGLYVQAERIAGPFESMPAVISHYKDILQAPFESSLTTEKWFFGDVSSSEAALLLQGQKSGTFIMRFSSVPGCLAVTYVTEDHSIRHSLIEPTPDRSGYVVQGSDVAYHTLPELIASTTVFVEPLC